MYSCNIHTDEAWWLLPEGNCRAPVSASPNSKRYEGTASADSKEKTEYFFPMVKSLADQLVSLLSADAVLLELVFHNREGLEAQHCSASLLVSPNIKELNSTIVEKLQFYNILKNIAEDISIQWL